MIDEAIVELTRLWWLAQKKQLLVSETVQADVALFVKGSKLVTFSRFDESLGVYRGLVLVEVDILIVFAIT